jgi:hypothetical protein
LPLQRVIMTTRCYKCEAEITFSEEIVSQKSGRMVPLDPYTMDRHQCPMYKPPRKYVPCRMCGMLLYFDPDAPKSVNDKWVPYEQRSGVPHDCPESDYNKNNGGTVPATTMTDEDRIARSDKLKENLVIMQETKRQEDLLNQL